MGLLRGGRTAHLNPELGKVHTFCLCLPHRLPAEDTVTGTLQVEAACGQHTLALLGTPPSHHSAQSQDSWAVGVSSSTLPQNLAVLEG